MTTVIRRWVLRNGLELEALDESRDYYGGYWNLSLIHISEPTRPY